MDLKLIEEFSRIPQVGEEYKTFIEDLKAENPAASHEITLLGAWEKAPETALVSLRKSSQTLPVEFIVDETFVHEEYQVENTPEKSIITAGGEAGFRYGIYFLEDHANRMGSWRRKPYVKHRISRCFFGPTYRPPFMIDELSNDIDYYPDGYLDKLAHENINGLWLTMYFRDLPSSIFPGRGELAQKRFAKLNKTIEKCGRYGIKPYIFFSEPKLFGHTHYSVPPEEAKEHPEVIGSHFTVVDFSHFCTSTEAGKTYLYESVKQLFDAAPGIGGIINIMLGEDNGSCVSGQVAGYVNAEKCPICSKRSSAEIYKEYVSIMKSAMPESAEFIGWYYAPGQRDGSPFSNALLEAVSQYPSNATVMFNIESGVRIEQLGKMRRVQDYSLACVQTSELFQKVAKQCERIGAKIQVGCSHEDASVPFVPVPSNLYEKYKYMHSAGVSTVMQCRYFGNYPGLMNKAAGLLSFEPFPESEEAFLEELLYPSFGKDAPKAAKAFSLFAKGYRQFPGNLAFEWFGPMHHSIAWPWHLFPVDKPISPSWILKQFPEVSGDRIGECLAFNHTLQEGLTLMEEMRSKWQEGFDILKELSTTNPGDVIVAEALLLQIKSTCNLLSFYSLREEMLYEKKDNLAAMRPIVLNEMENTERMLALCRIDSRLGYHSEAEGYLFFPEKLEARLKLLRILLEEDFPKFDVEKDAYDFTKGLVAKPSGNTLSNGIVWGWEKVGDSLRFTFANNKGKHLRLSLEPARMWTPLEAWIDPDGKGGFNEHIFASSPEVTFTPDSITIPLSAFDGFRREGFPLRVNVYSLGKGNKLLASWAPGELWPGRLMHAFYNPEMMGILSID